MHSQRTKSESKLLMLVIMVALYPYNHAIPYPLLKIILSFPLVTLLHVFPNKDVSLQMISQ